MTITTTATFGTNASPGLEDPDEALCTRLRDLALVEIDALVGDGDAAIVGAFADDVIDALKEARTRITALRAALGGADPLAILDASSRQRASDQGAARTHARLASQAEAARALARLTDLAAGLTPKLFEADRRR